MMAPGAPAMVEARRRRLSHQALQALRRARQHFAPPERLTITAWASRYRRMHSGPYAGNLFDPSVTPALMGVFEAYHDPKVRELWAAKSAQLGWTQGFALNVIGYHAHLDPCPILVLTAKDGDARNWSRQKLEPAIRASKVLQERIPLGLGTGASWDYKHFPGGWVQLAGANSPGNVKSTDYRVVIVEEPDDTSRNLREQGDSIALARERNKAYDNGKLVVGGTPTVKGFSKVWAGMARTDQRRMYVECPHCGHEQTLRWEQVDWARDAEHHHPIYGTNRHETARYRCEACGTPEQPELWWTPEQKNELIRLAARRTDRGWRATAPFNGAAGFYLSELYSTFGNSRLPNLVKLYLEAQHALDQGDDTLMRSFYNNQLGEPWELKSDSPELEALQARGEDYPLWTAPAGALLVSAFVDIQRGGIESGEPRLEYLVVGWGRDLESWRIARGVCLGNPLEEAVWQQLEAELSQPIRSAQGGTLPIRIVGVDTGDGMTQEPALRWIRARRREGRDVRATKGSSQRFKPIFTPPKALDHLRNDKAAAYGLKLYAIGVDAGKDSVLARLKLEGQGPGRMHWPMAIGSDYLEQVTSEIKVPGANGREEYKVLAGRRNEMLDCEVGNTWCAYALRLHSATETFWQQLEVDRLQPSLLGPVADAAAFTSPSALPVQGVAPTEVRSVAADLRRKRQALLEQMRGARR